MRPVTILGIAMAQDDIERAIKPIVADLVATLGWQEADARSIAEYHVDNLIEFIDDPGWLAWKLAEDISSSSCTTSS
jgi:hypothetical protein